MRKLAFILLALTFSGLSYGRQYIQCGSLDANSWDRMVINLNGEESTLFMTNGVHLPPNEEIRVLKKLVYVETTETSTIYTATDANVIETVTIPNEFINVYSNFFLVNINMERISDGYARNFDVSCYSALYDDK